MPNERSWIDFKPGEPIPVIRLGSIEGGKVPVYDQPLFEHAAFSAKTVVPCHEEWRKCVFCEFYAKNRGLVIHTLRVSLRFRHLDADTKRQLRDLARQHIRSLRRLGPGPVIMVDTRHLESDPRITNPIDWWGPRTTP